MKSLPWEISPKYPLWSLCLFTRPYALRVCFAVLAMLLATCALLAIPYAFGMIFDHGFSLDTLTERTESYRWFMVATLGAAVFSAWRFYLVSWLGEKVVADVRKKVFGSILRFDMQQFETLKTGEILSRLGTDTTLIQQVIGSSFSIFLRSALQALGALGGMLLSSAWLTLVFCVAVPLLMGPFWAIMRAQRALARENQDKIAEMGAFAGEVLHAIYITKAFAHEAYDERHYAHSVDEVYRAGLKRVRRRSVLVLVVVIALALALALVLWVGSQLVLQEGLTPGALAQFFSYSVFMVVSVLSMSEVWGDLQRITAASERIVELCTTKPSIVCGDYSYESSRVNAAITFDAVAFAYPARLEKEVLVDFSCSVGKGQTVALVGASGAGKSTVLQLLMRLYEAKRGSILIDNIPIQNLSLQALRASISVVPQEVVVFSGTIYDNIAYGHPEAKRSKVLEAAKAALVDEFVSQLADGYETPVGERGMRLSGGQRQRIAIARAFLRNAPILLLDEATSSLDAENERLVQTAIDRLMHKRTTIVIAHRLATVQKADKILVLYAGKVAACGTHQELMQSNARYAHLAKLQFVAD